MDDDLVAAHAQVPQLMPFLHLPVQSGSDRVLEAMNRRHSGDDYRRLVERLRAARGDIALSSDFIVGFPGESDADFAATLALVDEVGFAQAFSFKYSRRPGTPASVMARQVPEAVKEARLRALQERLAAQQASFNAGLVGRRLAVLFEGPGRHPGQIGGRSPYLQAVHVEGDESLIGTVGDVVVDAALSNSLAAHLVPVAARPACAGRSLFADASAGRSLFADASTRRSLSADASARRSFGGRRPESVPPLTASGPHRHGAQAARAGRANTSVIEFPDNRLAKTLYGEHDRHLAELEVLLDVELSPRGNRLGVRGSTLKRKRAEAVLRTLYADLKRGRNVDEAALATAVRMADTEVRREGSAIRTPRRMIEPRSPMQAHYLEALGSRDLVIAVGPAGTGKTYLAVAAGVTLMVEGRVERVILSRPAVEAGERLGFLPGDVREKVDPYLRPLYDALYDMLPPEAVHRKLESGEIEIAPLAFMRGRTLAHSYVILDEAQNATPVQMKMFVTRLGEQSRMVVTGDPSQVDLPGGAPSGLDEVCRILSGVEGVSVVRFTEADVVRHPLVTRIVEAYNAKTRGRGGRGGRGGRARQGGASRARSVAPEGQSGA